MMYRRIDLDRVRPDIVCADLRALQDGCRATYGCALQWDATGRDGRDDAGRLRATIADDDPDDTAAMRAMIR